MRAVDVALALAFLASACRREERDFAGAAVSNGAISGARTDELAVALPAGAVNPYAESAWAGGEGQRLYMQMNCVGCHANGGGGMGPALMDGAWIYGADDASIFTTIAFGRPNGMPSFRGRLSDQQIWQLVAYVQSLGGRRPNDTESSRGDHMSVRPGPARTDPLPTTKEERP